MANTQLITYISKICLSLCFLPNDPATEGSKQGIVLDFPFSLTYLLTFLHSLFPPNYSYNLLSDLVLILSSSFSMLLLEWSKSDHTSTLNLSRTHFRLKNFIMIPPVHLLSLITSLTHSFCTQILPNSLQKHTHTQIPTKWLLTSTPLWMLFLQSGTQITLLGLPVPIPFSLLTAGPQGA